jgi:MoaA/NifB/PqqE/SkfB family radical SAM enzyme
MQSKKSEWSTNKEWNPFNSYKLLSHVFRWRSIKKGNDIPPPVTVTIDPVNLCNLSCDWCNASFILNKSKSEISTENMLKIAEFLPNWKAKDDHKTSVESVCIAGGGEPLINKGVGRLIESLIVSKIEVGVVTNGTLIHNFLEQLSLCTWLGVSVDCAREDTFYKLKGNGFKKVIENIELINCFCSKEGSFLGRDGQGYGVSYKYLMTPENVDEIYEAAELAKNIGCRNFHLRPMGIPWNQLDSKEAPKYKDQLNKAIEQIEKARQDFENESFGVFGITHKFDEKMAINNKFDECKAVFMTAVFTPNNKSLGFDLGLCCDRRGDSSLILQSSIQDPYEIIDFWGSEKHWDIAEKINVNKCPRCTYQPHNRIFKHVIEEDLMTYRFI